MKRARYGRGYVELISKGHWKGHWFTYITEEGKERRVHHSKILGSKAKMPRYQAEEALRVLQIPLAEGFDKKRTPLSAFISSHWKPLREGRWKESTKQTNEELLDIIEAKFGDVALEDIGKVELQEWVDSLALKRSRSTVHHVRTFLRSILSEAVEEDFIAKDPTRHLRNPETRDPDGTVLEWVEYQAVLLELSLRDRLIVKVAGACALRPEELFAFRWKSLQRPNGRAALLIQETVYRGKLRAFGKTQGSMDFVAVPTLLAAELEEWRLTSKHAAANDFMFTNEHGGFINKDNYLNRVLYPVKRKLKLKMLNFQVLRRTFATRAYGEGKGTLKDVQKQMRHAKPNMALEHYIKAVPESVSAMVDSMYEKLIEEPKGRIQ